MAYKPQFTWEDDLRFEGGLNVLRSAIEIGISDENLIELIKKSFQPAQAEALLRKMQQGRAAILT